MECLKQEKAFTLIETMISLSIFAVVITLVNSLVFYEHSMWVKGKNKVNTYENLQYGLEKMTDELKSASGIISIENNNIISFYNAENKKITYYVDGEKELTRKVDSSSGQPIASYIDFIELYGSRNEANKIDGVKIIMQGEWLDYTKEKKINHIQLSAFVVLRKNQ